MEMQLDIVRSDNVKKVNYLFGCNKKYIFAET